MDRDEARRHDDELGRRHAEAMAGLAVPRLPGPPNPPRLDMSPEAIRRRNAATAAHFAEQRALAPEAMRQMREKLRERTAMIEELVWAMLEWSRDEEDTIHPDAYAAFRAAIDLVGIPISEEQTPGGEVDVRYRFDLDWSERQREQWRRRNAR